MLKQMSRYVCLVWLMLSGGVLWGHASLQGFTVDSTGSSEVFSTVSSTSTSDAYGHTTWAVTPNTALLSSSPATVPLNFPDRASVTLTRMRFQQRDSNGFLWTGRGGDCSAMFSKASTGFRGVISCLNAPYGVETAADGSVQLTRTPAASSASPWEPVPPAEPQILPPQSGGMAPTQTDTTVEILVLYNTAVRTALGGTAATIQFARDAVSSAQMAMDVSVPTGQPPLAELSFVGAAEVTRSDDGDIPGALQYMTVNSEPMGDRNFWSADWIVYLVATTGGSYLAVSNEPGYNNSFPLPPYFAPYAESVVLYNRAINDTSGSNDHEPFCFAHELGHIFGMNHDNSGTDNSNTTPLTSYSFGHWAPANGGGTRTVMSYLAPGCTAPCPRIINYSNPNVWVPPDDHSGFQTGNTNAYNAQMVTNYVSNVMGYMPSLGRIFVNGFEQYNQQ